MHRLPPLGPLASFRAASRHESFTRAAQDLHVTHGAVSRAIRQLEDFFGFPLFERLNRGVRLTERGRVFADRVNSLFSGLEDACDQLRESGTNRRLSVSCEPTLAMRWLMPRLEDFHRAAPDVDVHLSTAGGSIDLAAQGVDLAIRRSDFSWPEEYWHASLGRESVGPVCSPAYWENNEAGPKRMLHTRTRPKAWADWAHYSGTPLQEGSEQFFDHFYFTLQAAVAGLGMAIGPYPLVRDGLESGLLVAPFGFRETPVEYVVLCREEPSGEGRTRRFIDWLDKTLALP